MLVYQILLSVAVEDNGVAVKALYHPLELKAIGKIYCYRNLVLTCLIKKYVLKINIFVHSKLLFSADTSFYISGSICGGNTSVNICVTWRRAYCTNSAIKSSSKL